MTWLTAGPQHLVRQLEHEQPTEEVAGKTVAQAHRQLVPQRPDDQPWGVAQR